MSMTGFGKAIIEENGRKVTMEMKAVNHRFLDLLFKLPKGFAFVEDTIRKRIAGRLERGHIEIYLSYEVDLTARTGIALNVPVAKKYMEIASELEKEGFLNDLSVSQVLKLPDVIIPDSEEDDEQEIKNLVARVSDICIENLINMRKTEGARLLKDISEKLDYIEELRLEIKTRTPFVGEEHRERLQERITEVLAAVPYDETRLLNEVAYFVDKFNIDEELTRLGAHIMHAREIIADDKSSGKRLDFLVQEMNREVNTIGSKSNDIKITSLVLLLKGEVEKIREQVQNLE